MRSTKENHISTTQSQIRFGVPSVGTGLLKNIPGARRRQGPHSACSTLTLSCKLNQVLLQGWFCMPCAPPAWAAVGVPPPLLAEYRAAPGSLSCKEKGFLCPSRHSARDSGDCWQMQHLLHLPRVPLHRGQQSLWAVSPSFTALPFSADKYTNV